MAAGGLGGAGRAQDPPERGHQRAQGGTGWADAGGGKGRVIHHAHQKQSVGWCRRPGVPEEAQVQRQLNELQDGRRAEGTGR